MTEVAAGYVLVDKISSVTIVEALLEKGRGVNRGDILLYLYRTAISLIQTIVARLIALIVKFVIV